MSTKLVAVKLTATEHKALEQLVLFERYKTRSHALRAGLMLVLELHQVKLDTLAEIRIERIHHPMRRKKKRPDEE